MKRQVDYTWRLAELMAARGMHNSTELIPAAFRTGDSAVTAAGLSRGSSTPRTGFAADDRRTVRYLGLRRGRPGHRDREPMSVDAKRRPARRPRRSPTWSSSTRRCVLAEPECSAMTISPNRRSTKRGRPLVTDGQFRCSRCQRMANQRTSVLARRGQLCYSCFYAAMRTRGVCPGCGHDGVLPGLAIDADRQPICLSCAGIPGDFTCRRCGTEGDFYRRGTCARCALREDLTALMIDGAHDPDAMAPIVEALCRVERPASILTWKRSPRVQELLTGLASGEIPLTHQGLDEAGTDNAVNHLRSLLEHAGMLGCP